MRRFQKHVSGLTVAALVASGMAVFSVQAKASGGHEIPAATICNVLNAIETAVSNWPDSRVRTYVLAEIERAEAAHGCQ